MRLHLATAALWFVTICTVIDMSYTLWRAVGGEPLVVKRRETPRERIISLVVLAVWIAAYWAVLSLAWSAPR